jgi:hypothetical protein
MSPLALFPTIGLVNSFGSRNVSASSTESNWGQTASMALNQIFLTKQKKYDDDDDDDCYFSNEYEAPVWSGSDDSSSDDGSKKILSYDEPQISNNKNTRRGFYDMIDDRHDGGIPAESDNSENSTTVDDEFNKYSYLASVYSEIDLNVGLEDNSESPNSPSSSHKMLKKSTQRLLLTAKRLSETSKLKLE